MLLYYRRLQTIFFMLGEMIILYNTYNRHKDLWPANTERDKKDKRTKLIV